MNGFEGGPPKRRRHPMGAIEKWTRPSIELHRFLWLSTVLMLQGIGISAAMGQNVTSRISTTEAYVDSTVTFQIQFKNATSFQPPKIPAVDGLEIRSAGEPSRSSSVRIVNGRRSSSSTITYQYLVTPLRTGTFVIPAIGVQVQGELQSTSAHTIVVNTSETGDLLFVEIESDDAHAYVGEAVKLRLKIWLRPFTDRKLNLRLSERDMWQSFSRQTQWGTFAESLEELSRQNKRPGGQEELRKDSSDVSHAYYLYEIESVMYPKRPGEIDPGEVKIVVDYPTALGRSRSAFGDFDGLFGGSFFGRPRGGMAITASRPISASATLPPIEVVDVPVNGRPPGYRGAVGNYRFFVQAEPLQSKVGDPISLKMVIQGDGPMELVEAPPLIDLPTLQRDFRVDDESLAGFVQDDAKLFTTSIRPRHPDVVEIPAIPFSFFDPQSGEFKTVYSDPIPITVEANETLSLDAIVQNDRNAQSISETRVGTNAAEPESVAALFGVAEMLRSPPLERDSRARSVWLWVVGPLCCVVAATFFRRNDILAFLHRKRSPAGRARLRLMSAGTASEIRAALADLELEHTPAIQEVCRACDQASFSPIPSQTVGQLKQSALAALGNSALVFLVICGCMLSELSALAAEGSLSHVALNASQAETILSEAFALHSQAIELRNEDGDAFEGLLQRAIEKYQLVQSSGRQSPALLCNLGDAHVLRRQWGAALACFETAKRLGPRDPHILQRLRAVQTELGTVSTTHQAWWSRLCAYLVPYCRELQWAGWLSAWAGGIFVLVVPRLRRGRWFAAITVMLTISAIGTWAPWWARDQFNAVLIVESAQLRQADGDDFPAIDVLKEGQPLVVQSCRGAWAQVAVLGKRQLGWIQIAELSSVE